jgi:hypothetical protein
VEKEGDEVCCSAGYSLLEDTCLPYTVPVGKKVRGGDCKPELYSWDGADALTAA